MLVKWSEAACVLARGNLFIKFVNQGSVTAAVQVRGQATSLVHYDAALPAVLYHTALQDIN